MDRIRPRIHLSTFVFLMLVSALILWLNLKPSAEVVRQQGVGNFLIVSSGFPIRVTELKGVFVPLADLKGSTDNAQQVSNNLRDAFKNRFIVKYFEGFGWMLTDHDEVAVRIVPLICDVIIGLIINAIVWLILERRIVVTKSVVNELGETKI
jgi:hypothetical protein